jgi:hypothetical protein
MGRYSVECGKTGSIRVWVRGGGGGSKGGQTAPHAPRLVPDPRDLQVVVGHAELHQQRVPGEGGGAFKLEMI